MFFKNLMYSFISVNAVLCSFSVVIAKNAIHSVLMLIFVFMNIMCLILIMKMEFLGLVVLLLYVGAVAVLFLFIVMMLNIKVLEFSGKRINYVPLGVVVLLIFLFEIFSIFEMGLGGEEVNMLEWVENYEFDLSVSSNIKCIGSLIYSYYICYFLISSLILLLAMVGSICITYVKDLEGHRQETTDQVLRDYNKSVRFVSLKKKKNI